jgi:hypothetical protein
MNCGTTLEAVPSICAGHSMLCPYDGSGQNEGNYEYNCKAPA